MTCQSPVGILAQAPTGGQKLTSHLRWPYPFASGFRPIENVVMVRAMRAMGVDYAAEYLQRFGFPAQNIVHSESLALGSASFTPLQLVRGYAVLANGGYLVDPYFITKSLMMSVMFCLKQSRRLSVITVTCRSFTVIPNVQLYFLTTILRTLQPRRTRMPVTCQCQSWNR